MANPGEPTHDEIREALNLSGFILEQRVALALERSGYDVRVAQSYLDPDEGVPREIDVVAQKPLPDPGFNAVPMRHIIVVECKSTPQPHVVFTRDWYTAERKSVIQNL